MPLASCSPLSYGPCLQLSGMLRLVSEAHHESLVRSSVVNLTELSPSAKYKTYGLPAYYLDGFYDYLYSYDSTSGWKAGVAAAVFGAFLWLLFILTTVFSLIHGRKAGFGRTGVHNTHGTGMGGVGTAPVYGNNTGMGAPTTGQGYPMDNSMNNQGMGHPGMNQPGMGQPGMGQPAYNTGAPTNMGGYNNAPAYNAGPVHGNPV